MHSRKKILVGIAVGVVLILLIWSLVWRWHHFRSCPYFSVYWDYSDKPKVMEFQVVNDDDEPVAGVAVWGTNDIDTMGGHTDQNGYLAVEVEGEGPIWRLEVEDFGHVEWYVGGVPAEKGVHFAIRLKERVK